MNQQIAIEVFRRASQITVTSQVSTSQRAVSASGGMHADYLSQIVHNMHMLNYKLTKSAIELVKKARQYSSVDVESLMRDCKSIITHAIEDYTRRV